MMRVYRKFFSFLKPLLFFIWFTVLKDRKLLCFSYHTKSIWGQYLKNLVDVYPVFPWFLCHFLDESFQPFRACLIEFQSVVFCLAIDFQLSLTIKWKIFIIKGVHADSDRPDVTGLAREPIFSLKLMFRSPETRSPRREKWNVIFVVSYCGEIC